MSLHILHIVHLIQDPILVRGLKLFRLELDRMQLFTAWPGSRFWTVGHGSGGARSAVNFLTPWISAAPPKEGFRLRGPIQERGRQNLWIAIRSPPGSCTCCCTGWPRSYRKYILQITQPSKYIYAKLQYRSAVTSGSPGYMIFWIRTVQ